MEKKLLATAANETDWRNKLTKTRIGSVTLPGYLVTASIILVTALLEQLPVNMLGG
ncbi:malate permease, partial [Enterococcus faecalis]